jgi:hypothetical protein
MGEAVYNLVGTGLCAVGTLLTIFSIQIVSSPIETTYHNGKPMQSALINLSNPLLFWVGIVGIILGFTVLIVGYTKQIKIKRKEQR